MVQAVLSASIELHDSKINTADIRTVQSALGDKDKKVLDTEVPIREKIEKSLNSIILGFIDDYRSYNCTLYIQAITKKMLLPFGEWTIIEHIIKRTKHYGIDPILCTSIDSDDDELEKIAHQENIKVFRGSLGNKLKRWYDCCEYFQIDRFHSIDADDLFFDGELIHQSMDLLDKGYDVVVQLSHPVAGMQVLVIRLQRILSKELYLSRITQILK